ncbi:MAG TPA: UPF0149 family protein [Xanthomonadaceae bacterium]|nr:UPF0149 family protein [Xanthomonadaceae bacterium]
MSNLYAPDTLTDDQIDRLQSLLMREDLGDNVMDIEALDGFLSALIVGPAPVLPSEYLPEIFDGSMPQWDSAEQAVETISLIQSLWNHIVGRLDIDLDEVEQFADAIPLMAWPQVEGGADAILDPFQTVPEGYPLCAVWATGFMHGMTLRQDAWDDFIDAHPDIAEHLEWIMRLSLVSQEQLEDVGIENTELLDHDQRLTAVAQLPRLLKELNDLRLAAG